MNNLKEKLCALILEGHNLLNERVENWILGGKAGCRPVFSESVADHLIANGVTIPEWISVEERLPEDSDEVNLCTRSGIVGIGYYDKYRKNWVQYYAGGALCVDVTHWMPLPKPPKGE